MPRWLFILLCVAVALSVVGSVLIVLRSPAASVPGAARSGTAR